MHYLVAPSNSRDGNYSFPTYEKGYHLAERTRELLDLDSEEPIESIRALVEEKLNIPLIQVSLDPRFAGATIANGSYRGIVVNERGKNSDVAVRRMTICHELAHLLWDPDERLDRIIVDEYERIEFGASQTFDQVEMRANAFAVAFLAPRSAVKAIVEESSNISEALAKISSRFGISLSAARYHVHNVTRHETRAVKVDGVNFDSWIPAENLTIDFLPGLEGTASISRKGLFSGIVARAFLDGRISADTGAMCLKTSVPNFAAAAKGIAGMWARTQVD